MPNSIYFLKGTFFHVIPVCISSEIIQFFKSSREESIYHIFMHETIIHSFTIYVCRQDIVLLNRLLSASYEIICTFYKIERWICAPRESLFTLPQGE